MQKLPYILTGFGFLLIAVSLSALVWGPGLLESQAVVQPIHSSRSWDASQHETENYLKIYFFNVSNPEEAVAGNKPDLQEIGPYVYQMKSKIVDDTSKMDEFGRVAYKEIKTYYYRPDLTLGSLQDVVTIINVPYVGLAQEVAKLSTFPRMLVMGVITRFDERLFLTKTADQLLFGGFHHELLATLSSITGEEYMPNNTFGMFYGRNNSNNGEFIISAPTDKSEDLGKIVTWNGTNELEWWDDEACKRFDGSYDEITFPPRITKDIVFRIFDPMLCRTFKYGFKKEITFKGIPGYRFFLLPSDLEDPRTRPENMCYCTSPGIDLQDCPRNGSFQRNACSKGASVSISYPHFLFGSEEYLNKANGYHPDEALHEDYFDIEPETGTLLTMMRRFQANLHLRPLRLFTGFKKVSNMLFPSIWTEQSREITDERVKELLPLFAGTETIKYMVKIGGMVGAALGVGLIGLAVGIFIIRVRNDKTKYTT